MECLKLEDEWGEIKIFDVIAIGEAQFFTDIVDVNGRLASEGKLVLVPALDGNFKSIRFNIIIHYILQPVM